MMTDRERNSLFTEITICGILDKKRLDRGPLHPRMEQVLATRYLPKTFKYDVDVCPICFSEDPGSVIMCRGWHRICLHCLVEYEREKGWPLWTSGPPKKCPTCRGKYFYSEHFDMDQLAPDTEWELVELAENYIAFRSIGDDDTATDYLLEMMTMSDMLKVRNLVDKQLIPCDPCLRYIEKCLHLLR